MSGFRYFEYDADGFILHADWLGLHKIHLATFHDDTEKVRKLLEEGVNPNLRIRSYPRQTSLHIAVQRLHLEVEWTSDNAERSPVNVVKSLLEHKASVDAKDENGIQPLYYLPLNCVESTKLCMQRALPMLDLLLDCKADINHKNTQGHTLLSHCCVIDNKSLFEEILDRNADPRDEQAIYQALFWASPRYDRGYYLNSLQKRTKLIEGEW